MQSNTFNKPLWARLAAGSLLSLTLMGSGCFLFEDDGETKEEVKEGEKKEGEMKEGEKKEEAAKVEVPAYAPEGDDAEMKKAGAEGITADNAMEKAKELEKELDEALAK